MVQTRCEHALLSPQHRLARTQASDALLLGANRTRISGHLRANNPQENEFRYGLGVPSIKRKRKVKD